MHPLIFRSLARTMPLPRFTHGPGEGPLRGDHHTGGVEDIVFSPVDPQVLATVGRDGIVKLWSLPVWNLLSECLSDEVDIQCLAFSKDGALLAGGCSDGTIRVWHALTGQAHCRPFGRGPGIVQTAFVGGGKQLLTVSSDKTLRLWEIASGRLLGEPICGNGCTVKAVVLSPDGRLLACGPSDGDESPACKIELYRTADGRLLGAPLTGHRSSVISAAFSRDGTLLAAGSEDGTILIWNLASGQPPETIFGHQRGVWSLAFSPDGRFLVSGSGDTMIQLWDTSTNRALLAPLDGHRGGVSRLAISDNGEWLASASTDKSVWLRKFPAGTAGGRPLQNVASRVTRAALSGDGLLLASAAIETGKTPRLQFRATSGRRSTVEGPDQAEVTALALSEQGEIAASAMAKRVYRWETRTGRRRDETGRDGNVASLAVSSDGTMLASGLTNGSVDLAVDHDAGQHLVRLGRQGNCVSHLAFSPQGHLLASASTALNLVLWDLVGKSSPRSIRNADDNTGYAPVFSPDGQRLAAASRSHAIWLYDLDGVPWGEPCIGHQSLVTTLAFEPEGKWFVSGSNDRTARIWSVETRECLHLWAFSGRVLCVGISRQDLPRVIVFDSTGAMTSLALRRSLVQTPSESSGR